MSNKNDFVDAEAVAEAVERKNMRVVPIKTDDQYPFPQSTAFGTGWSQDARL